MYCVSEVCITCMKREAYDISKCLLFIEGQGLKACVYMLGDISFYLLNN